MKMSGSSSYNIDESCSHKLAYREPLLLSLSQSAECHAFVIVVYAASAWFPLGADLDLSKEGNKEATQFQEAMQDFTALLSKFSEALPIYKIYPTPLYKKIKQAVVTIRTVEKWFMEQNYILSDFSMKVFLYCW